MAHLKLEIDCSTLNNTLEKIKNCMKELQTAIQELENFEFSDDLISVKVKEDSNVEL